MSLEPGGELDAPAVSAAPRALSILAIVSAAIGPVLIVVLALVAVVLNRFAMLFGMPNADAALAEMLTTYTRPGVYVGTALTAVALVLVVVARTRHGNRGRSHTIAWVVVITSALFIVATLSLPQLLS